MNIALLGLGIIGSRVASRLGSNPVHQLRSWNRTPRNHDSEVPHLDEAIADADVTLLFLKNREAVREVAESILPLVKPGSTMVNHSTVDLETTRWLASRCDDRNLGFLDAPFTGSREASAQGKLFYYTAGDPALIDRLEPLLLESAGGVLRCGVVGNATIIKLATNAVSASAVQTLAEALATTTRHGIPAETLTQAIANNANASPLAAMKLPSMANGDFDTHFSLENMLKDCRYALTLAKEKGLDLPSLEAVTGRMEELCGEGMGNRDFSTLAAPYLKP